MDYIFSGYRALMDLEAQILDRAQGLTAPRSGSCPSPGIRAGSEDSLDRRRVDPGSWAGETHQAKLGEAGTVASHPKIQNPESGIRDSTW